MADPKGDKLFVNLGASKTRQRLKNFGHGVKKVQSAGRNRAAIIHTATGRHLAELQAKFADVGYAHAENSLPEPRSTLPDPHERSFPNAAESVTRTMMCRWSLCLLSAIVCCTVERPNPCRAQDSPSTESRSSGAEQLPSGAASFASWIESARELRLAAERVVTRLATMLEVTSENMSEMSSQFDPFGFKTAFQTIQLQNETIQRLMEAEIDVPTSRSTLGQKWTFRPGSGVVLG